MLGRVYLKTIFSEAFADSRLAEMVLYRVFYVYVWLWVREGVCAILCKRDIFVVVFSLFPMIFLLELYFYTYVHLAAFGGY